MSAKDSDLAWAVELLRQFGATTGENIVARAGSIIMRKVSEQGIDLDALTEHEMDGLLRAGFYEAACEVFPHADQDQLLKDVEEMFAEMAMDLDATHDGGDAVN